MQSNVELKQQLAARSIPIGTVAALASTAQSRIFPTDLSHFFKGRAIAPAKADAIRKASETLIDLCDAVEIKPDWRDVNNVRAAIAKLDEIRRKPAQAPWQFRGTEVSHADAPQTDLARAALAGAPETNS
jgi:hypothetical protein